MSDENLKDIIKRKNERIDDLENKNQVLYNLLYQSKQELGRLKDIIKERFDDPSEVLDQETNS